MIMMAWKFLLVTSALAAFTKEVNRLTVRIGKRSADMNKDELVEVAQRELGMNLGQAQAETVMTLRERIRQGRELTKLKNLDPEAQLPKGLGAMKLEDLVEEVKRRQLSLSPKPTRAAPQILIRDDVSSRATDLTTDQTWSMSAAAPNDNGEWDMCEDDRS
jgi:hypothetical protein